MGGPRGGGRRAARGRSGTGCQVARARDARVIGGPRRDGAAAAGRHTTQAAPRPGGRGAVRPARDERRASEHTPPGTLTPPCRDLQPSSPPPRHPRHLLAPATAGTHRVRTFFVESCCATIEHLVASSMTRASEVMRSDSGNRFASASCSSAFNSSRPGQRPQAAHRHTSKHVTRRQQAQ